MKANAYDFALLGGVRTFPGELPVGQLYFPEWTRYEAAMRDIIGRQYYTNHGPVVRMLETRLESYFGVRNVVTVTNATIGLYLVALGLGLQGKILMPSFTFIATAQAAVLAGLEPVFCDVDRDTHLMTPLSASRALEDGVTGVCGVNLWGSSTDAVSLEKWSKSNGLMLFFDSAQGFGVETEEGRLGRFGHAEVFSFHATKVMSATEGGCICTDDDELAERLRNMRSNYGIRSATPVPLTVNARMSEAQAAIALMSLEDVDEHISKNRSVYEAYRSALSGLPGVRLIQPKGVTKSNFQSVVLEIDEVEYGLPRDLLWALLRAEGVNARRYFKPGLHRSVPFNERRPCHAKELPVTDALCASLLQLPTGAQVTPGIAEQVGTLIQNAHTHAKGVVTSVP